MRLYLAGVYTSNFWLGGRTYAFLDEVEARARRSIKHYLESYHYIGKGRYAERIRGEGVRVFLDSGAFSAYTKGVDVDLPAYCRFIRENADIIEYASVLDAIGDPDQTWRNQKAMEALGVQPLPCYHYGEPEEVLQYYVAEYEYITIGGMVPISTPQLRLWLDRIWHKYLTDEQGKPIRKVHGFGMTSFDLMARYPWFSVDSSSWVQAGSIDGSIAIPELFGQKVKVSDVNPATKKLGNHYDNLPPEQKEVVRQAIEGPGFVVDRVRTTYGSRWAYNCYSFVKMEDMLSAKREFVPDQPALF